MESVALARMSCEGPPDEPRACHVFADDIAKGPTIGGLWRWMGRRPCTWARWAHRKRRNTTPCAIDNVNDACAHEKHPRLLHWRAHTTHQRRIRVQDSGSQTVPLAIGEGAKTFNSTSDTGESTGLAHRVREMAETGASHVRLRSRRIQARVAGVPKKRWPSRSSI